MLTISIWNRSCSTWWMKIKNTIEIDHAHRSIERMTFRFSQKRFQMFLIIWKTIFFFNENSFSINVNFDSSITIINEFRTNFQQRKILNVFVLHRSLISQFAFVWFAFWCVFIEFLYEIEIDCDHFWSILPIIFFFCRYIICTCRINDFVERRWFVVWIFFRSDQIVSSTKQHWHEQIVLQMLIVIKIWKKSNERIERKRWMKKLNQIKKWNDWIKTINEMNKQKRNSSFTSTNSKWKKLCSTMCSTMINFKQMKTLNTNEINNVHQWSNFICFIVFDFMKSWSSIENDCDHFRTFSNDLFVFRKKFKILHQTSYRCEKKRSRHEKRKRNRIFDIFRFQINEKFEMKIDEFDKISNKNKTIF